MVKTEYEVKLKKGARTVRAFVTQDRAEADRATQAWYQEADDHRFEIAERAVVMDQVHPHIEQDQYLTQSRVPYSNHIP
jgi:hypothetical protein